MASTLEQGASNPGLVDLEKELSCSICTEILYEPLTLLDCLHTFCGSCLKEWFGWQRQRVDQEYERYHNARERVKKRRKPYAYTCPSCRAVVRGTRPNATVTTLLDMYLSANPERQKTRTEKQEIAKIYTPGDKVLVQRSDSEPSGRRDESTEGAISTEEDERQTRQRAQELSLTDRGAPHPTHHARTGDRHHNRTDSRATHTDGEGRSNGQDRSRSRAVQLGHQSSLRSLLNPHDSEEMREEILRQIVEEGILDDVDWENLQLEQEDEISERIAQAYKRRRRRPRPSPRRRAESRQREARSREPPRSRSAQRQARHARSTSASQTEDQGRSDSALARGLSAANLPPLSRPHPFEASSRETRRRRRSSSQARPDPSRLGSQPTPQHAASRSATDLSDRPSSHDSRHDRATRRSEEGRRSTDPVGVSVSEQWRSVGALPTLVPRARPERRRSSQPSSAPPTRTMFEPPPAPEPAAAPSLSVSCDRCGRESIQQTLHYTCLRCGPPGTTYDLCLRCYRLGRGCLHWFGFGQAAWHRWQRRALAGDEPPHTLKSQKYLDPANLPSGVTISDSTRPLLQRGFFCDVCQENANSCYWHCPHCSDGEWGYCQTCVNQAKHCVHPLLPMTLESSVPAIIPVTPPNGDQSPHSITPAFEPKLTPLLLPTTCNICQQNIPTTAHRLHCPDCCDGDYDMCMDCYEKLNPSTAARAGSRKCPQGHRLLLADFATTNGATDVAWRRVLEGQSGAWVPEGLIPPAAGNPHRAEAIWPWIPEDGVRDEIAFPKGAIVEDVVPMNDEFSWGVFCRRGGYFPSKYVRPV